MFRYTVTCEFSNSDQKLADRWIGWLRNEHLADVINAGATSAEVVQLDGRPLTVEVRYDFASRATYEAYERDHAPRLRAEGLEKFPLEMGLKFRRSTGQVLIERDLNLKATDNSTGVK